MSRLSCVPSCLWSDLCAFKGVYDQVAYVQTLVRSKLSMSRQTCVQSCLCPDYRAFKVAYVQTIVRSTLPTILPRQSCVQSCLCSDYSAFNVAYYPAFKVTYVQTIVRSKLPISRLSCVKDTYVQTFVRSLVFPDRVILNKWHPPPVRSFWSVPINFRSGTSTRLRFIQTFISYKGKVLMSFLLM